MLTVLITGAAGFLGTHLRAALERKYSLLLADRRLSEGEAKESVPSGWIEVAGHDDLPRAVAEFRPDFVVHTAFVNRKPSDLSDSTYLGDMVSYNLPFFQSCAEVGAGLLLTSSSAVYGSCRADSHLPIDENCPTSPVSLYGVAKLLQETLARYAATTAGLQTCVVRLFNLCGPGQRRGMLLPDWVAGAVDVARGGEPVVRVSNRSTSRDFVDVRDAARAILLLLERFEAGTVVNVASGRAVSLTEISEALAALCPVPYKVVETAPVLARSDLPIQTGSFARIESGWGWSPSIPFPVSLRDVWNERYRAR